MREFFSFCFEQLTDPLTLPINPISEWIILALLNKLAYCFAFARVGDLYHSGVIRGSFIGSLIHWVVRFVAFVFVWGVADAVIRVCQFVAEHWLMILYSAGIGLVVAIVGVICYHFLWKKKLDPKKQVINKTESCECKKKG